jgi:hypothetical protein
MPINYDCYSVDASIMIKMKDMLPQDIFKQAWDEIERLIVADRWKIFENVADEIHGESAQKWIKENSFAIVKFNTEINSYINKLMAELQEANIKLVDPISLKNNADPFVIMLALYFEKRDLANLKQKTCDKTCCVLTNEEPKKDKINIPYVCEYYTIPYMNLFDFMRHHGWQIDLHVQNP